jgi:hypothetical protein
MQEGATKKPRNLTAPSYKDYRTVRAFSPVMTRKNKKSSKTFLLAEGRKASYNLAVDLT